MLNISCALKQQNFHQWPGGSTFKREVSDSISGRACEPSRSEFSVLFSENRVNTGTGPLERSPWMAFHLESQAPRACHWTFTPASNTLNPKKFSEMSAFCYFLHVLSLLFFFF